MPIVCRLLEAPRDSMAKTWLITGWSRRLGKPPVEAVLARRYKLAATARNRLIARAPYGGARPTWRKRST
jgi:hypothetical protein